MLKYERIWHDMFINMVLGVPQICLNTFIRACIRLNVQKYTNGVNTPKTAQIFLKYA